MNGFRNAALGCVLAVCGLCAGEPETSKSRLVAKSLNLIVPAGGLGYKYLQVWDQEYGPTMLATQAGLFTGGVGLLVVGNVKAGRDSPNSDVAIPAFDNPYGAVGLVLLLAWAGTQIWSVQHVNHACDLQANGVNCSF